MEAQTSRNRGTRTRNRISGLGKTTRGGRVHVQTVGLNAETKMERHRAAGEIFLLTFLFIGLRRLGRFSGPGRGVSVYPHPQGRILTGPWNTWGTFGCLPAYRQIKGA